MRTLSILHWAAIGGGVPLGGCLQKSGLLPLSKNRERKREKEKEGKLCNSLCSALLPTCYTV